MVSPAWVLVVIFVIEFHASELALAIKYHSLRKVSWRNTLVSLPLLGAYAVVTVESLWHQQLSPWPARVLGLGMMVFGELIRKWAIITAGKSFNHEIVETPSPEHQLVSTGPFAIIRHPGYAGYLMFAIGSTIYLGNWFCVVSFGCILYRFFDERLAFEETTLVELFPNAYVEYSRRVAAFPFRDHVARLHHL